MIFLTIGGSDYGFARLVKKGDELGNKLNEKLIMQIGTTEYKPKNAQFFRFKPRDEIGRYYSNARLIIGHAGMGTILSACKHKKPLIIVPRRKKYNEIIDDHQFEIAKKLEKEGIASVVYDEKNLHSAITNLNKSDIKHLDVKNPLTKNLKKYLEVLEVE